jgi:hypothetical protein
VIVLVFRIIGGVAFLTIMFFAITQILIPAFRKRPLFPMLDKKRTELESHEADVFQDQDDEYLARRVREEEAKLKSIKKGTDSNPNTPPRKGT